MKKNSIKSITRLVAATLSAAICVTTASTSVFAETINDENQISIINYSSYEDNGGDFSEIFDEPIDTSSDPTMYEEPVYSTYDTGYPRKFHDLSSSEYFYKGGSDNLKLYTLTYYKPTSAGSIFLEGRGQLNNVSNYSSNNLVIDIYEQKTRERLASFSLRDYYLASGSGNTYYYYKFAIINLDPEKNYFIGFRGDGSRYSFNVEGYIAHDWTNHYDFS